MEPVCEKVQRQKHRNRFEELEESSLVGVEGDWEEMGTR